MTTQYTPPKEDPQPTPPAATPQLPIKDRLMPPDTVRSENAWQAAMKLITPQAGL